MHQWDRARSSVGSIRCASALQELPHWAVPACRADAEVELCRVAVVVQAWYPSSSLVPTARSLAVDQQVCDVESVKYAGATHLFRLETVGRVGSFAKDLVRY